MIFQSSFRQAIACSVHQRRSLQPAQFFLDLTLIICSPHVSTACLSWAGVMRHIPAKLKQAVLTRSSTCCVHCTLFGCDVVVEIIDALFNFRWKADAVELIAL